MGWRLAKCLHVLRTEVNAAYPNRPTGSDGTIGDAAHSSRTSDHNPNSAGVVCAIDLTEWVQNGVEMNDVLAEHLRQSRDKRIKYVISDGRMFSSYSTPKRPAWEWGVYTGTNAHTKHVHVSVSGAYDDTRSWGFYNPSAQPQPTSQPTQPAPVAKEDYVIPPTVRKGDKGHVVGKMQGLLNAHGHKQVTVDGDFGQVSEDALKRHQAFWKARGRVNDVDGICGPQSWKSLIEL